MAKTATNTTAGAIVFTLASLNAGLQKQVQNVKRPILNLSDKFSVVRESVKAELGPRVMKLFNAIKNEHAAFSFVDFVRLFNPDLPTHAADNGPIEGYRNNKVYYTLDYMRRISTQRPRGQQGTRDKATDGLARSIATLLQVVEPDLVWRAVQSQFQMTERQMTGLRRRVKETDPLFQLSASRVKVGNIINMESHKKAVAETATEAAAIAQSGRRLRGRTRVAQSA